jgi:hypothetical protein
MQNAAAVTLVVFFFAGTLHAQENLPTFKAQAASAFVWGEDNGYGAISSSILDPVNGNTIRTLSYGGIEVSTKAGFEGIGLGPAREFLNFTATVVNNKDSNVAVRFGGANVDERPAAPLTVVSRNRNRGGRDQKNSCELEKLECFVSGFLAGENFFAPKGSSQVFTVASGGALTVSLVTKDPRKSPMRCSTRGCNPTGTMRVSVVVNTTDFVFVWPGSSAVYCGK